MIEGLGCLGYLQPLHYYLEQPLTSRVAARPEFEAAGGGGREIGRGRKGEREGGKG